MEDFDQKEEEANTRAVNQSIHELANVFDSIDPINNSRAHLDENFGNKNRDVGVVIERYMPPKITEKYEENEDRDVDKKMEKIMQAQMMS